MWTNAQKWEPVLAVDVVGGSQGRDFRTMAEEAGILDLHGLTFSPFSSAVHGHRYTIARFNPSFCDLELYETGSRELCRRQDEMKRARQPDHNSIHRKSPIVRSPVSGEVVQN